MLASPPVQTVDDAMHTDAWSRVDKILKDALELEPHERAQFLEQVCPNDPSVKRQVETLIRSFDAAGNFLESPVLSLVGKVFGTYEVKTLVGRGGMGEVYVAWDARLKRDVAIKVLPDEFSSNTERVLRFQREAEVLASLNHPNIAVIHDVATFGKLRFLVLELVEGETLEEKLARGAMPIREALNVAKQIAEALEAAHEKAIVHRDLKPANVKITPQGKVKVLDFGLAKPVQSAESHPPNTNPGMILGTAPYMAPEQAKGRTVDRRADIFAFGCVLYEMLTGETAFKGADVTEILGRVVTTDPDWQRLPGDTPSAILRLLHRALKKDPYQRLGDIRDARLEIEEAWNDPQGSAMQSQARPRHRQLPFITVAALLMAFVFAIPATRHLRETPVSNAREMRVEITTPSTPSPLEFALSPDGREIVFVASGDRTHRLWLRRLDKTEAQPIAGTEGASYPFWSPDGRSIGFFTPFSLARVDVGGGAPQSLADGVPAGRGGAWNSDGTILYSLSNLSAISRIPASGGRPTRVSKIGIHQTSHRWPEFLPDGRHFLFFVQGNPDTAGIYIGSLDGEEPKRLTPADTAARYLNPGWIIYVRQGTLVARHLDIERKELSGDPLVLAQAVGYDSTVGMGGFSVAASGEVAYRAGGSGNRRQLTWFDRTGKTIGVVGEPDPENLVHPELSPDGRRVSVQRTVQGNADIWLMDLIRGGLTRLTFNAGLDNQDVWSPDGTRIAYASGRGGELQLYVKPASGVGSEELLLETPNSKGVRDWSKDGHFLLYDEVDPKTNFDLWILDMTGNERKRRVVANTPAVETNGQFSPNGRWVAYQTNESGRYEIVVQSFPEPKGKWQLSTQGGTHPRWSADGKELYFIEPDGGMMATPITSSGFPFEAGTAAALFSVRMVGFGGPGLPQYAVSHDGRFLINQPWEESSPPPITLILNWKPQQKN